MLTKNSGRLGNEAGWADPTTGYVMGSTVSDPARKAAAVTPHNTTAITGGPCRALYVGVGGTLVVLLADDSATVTLLNVPNGTLLALSATRVHSTGTTCTDIVALW